MTDLDIAVKRFYGRSALMAQPETLVVVPGPEGIRLSDPLLRSIGLLGIPSPELVRMSANTASASLSTGGNIIPAAACSRAAVAAAYLLASDGDEITVPAGTATDWTTQLTVTKAITIRGAGMTNSFIQDNNTTSSVGPGFGTERLFHITLVAGKTTRLTGFSFLAGTRTPALDTTGRIGVFGSNTNSSFFRMDHCKQDHNGSVLLKTHCTVGLFDHNECYWSGFDRPLTIEGRTWNGGSDWGDASWTAGPGFGTDQFFFVEDNIFEHDTGVADYACIDGFAGARYVLRYNTMNRCWAEAHGTDSSDRWRGTRCLEMYNNVINNTGGTAQTDYLANVRSGTAIIHDNVATGVSGTGKFELAVYRIGTGGSGGTWQPWGRALGSAACDKNSGGLLVTAIDQSGMALGSLVTGAGTPVFGWAAGNNDQVVEPCYEWNNTYNSGSNANFNATSACIVSGTHFFNNTVMPGYTTFTYPHPGGLTP